MDMNSLNNKPSKTQIAGGSHPQPNPNLKRNVGQFRLVPTLEIPASHNPKR